MIGGPVTQPRPLGNRLVINGEMVCSPYVNRISQLSPFQSTEQQVVNVMELDSGVIDHFINNPKKKKKKKKGKKKKKKKKRD